MLDACRLRTWGLSFFSGIFLSLSPAPGAPPTTLPAATLVDIKVQDGSASEALSQIQLQVQKDVALVFPPAAAHGLPPVTIARHDCLFWDAIMEVCQQSKLSFYCSSSGDTRPSIHFRQEAADFNQLPQPISRAGGCLVIAKRAVRTRELVFGEQQPPSDAVTLKVDLLVDPALRVTEIYPAVVTRAEDENGQSMRIRKADRKLDIPAPRYPYSAAIELVKHTEVHLPGTAAFGRKLKVLQGAVPVLAIVATEPVSVDDPLVNLPVTRDFPDYSLMIARLRPNGNTGYVMDVRFTVKQQPRYEDYLRARSRDYQSLLRDITLTDETGHRFIVRYGGGGISKGIHEFSPWFVAHPGETPGRPTRLVWKLPSAEGQIEVPFEFHDLPIP